MLTTFSVNLLCLGDPEASKMRSKTKPTRKKREEKREKERERREESAFGVGSNRSSILYAFQREPGAESIEPGEGNVGGSGAYRTLSQQSAATGYHATDER